MNHRSPLRIAYIGNGGIAHSVRETLAQGVIDYVTVGILDQPSARGDLPLVKDVDELLSRRPDVVVECASHEAVADYGERVLTAGVPLIVVSIGALARPALHEALTQAAVAGNTRLILASGALAGLDALCSAKLGGLTYVRYVGRKPPEAWLGTAAEALIDLRGLTTATVIYRGSAREAATQFPKNSNVAATIALAGLGFEKTEVELIADPGTTKNIHELEFAGVDGRFEIAVVGEPSKANPKTSALTARSVARLIHGMAAPVVF